MPSDERSACSRFRYSVSCLVSEGRLKLTSYFLREMLLIDEKKREFEERNVDFILKNCEQAGFDPIKRYGITRFRLK